MEFRDKLLSSEMRHVTEMVNLLSCELVILQDFLMHTFGPKYSKFRKGHALGGEGIIHLSPGRSYGTSLSTKKIITPAVGRNLRRSHNNTGEPSSSRNNRSSDNVQTSGSVTGQFDASKKSKVDSEEVSEPVVLSSAVEGGEDEGEEPVVPYTELGDFSAEIEGADDDNDMMSSTSDSECDKADMEWTESKYSGSAGPSSSSRSKRGNISSNIWNKFNCTKLPDGKKQVTCPNCQEKVSPVAKRLQKHYDRCVLGVYKSETSSVVTSSPTKKPKGDVWAHFDKGRTDDGKVIVTCNYCNKKVSNHVTRMTKHLQQICKKFPGLNESQS